MGCGNSGLSTPHGMHGFFRLQGRSWARKSRMTTKVRVEGFTISLDGFGAGPDQGLDNPLGVGGLELHGWLIGTRTFQMALFGNDGGSTGTDDDFAARGFQNIGPWVMGRNMFGPIRGPWPDELWKGWWGDNPPYHCPVFVLTRHPREPVEMKGGTVFHFVTEGLPEAFNVPARPRAARMSGWVAGWPPSNSVYRRASSTRCTWRSRPFCSVPGSVCSLG